MTPTFSVYCEYSNLTLWFYYNYIPIYCICSDKFTCVLLAPTEIFMGCLLNIEEIDQLQQ